MSGAAENLGAPPRLAAHLRAVHDVAHQLIDWIGQRYLGLHLDRDPGRLLGGDIPGGQTLSCENIFEERGGGGLSHSSATCTVEPAARAARDPQMT